ncbi:FAD-dependent oxidoreductase [Sphingomonas sp. HITSZ_GF]|uniref:FAD-dependent oxidoreductase n=1 Tax=Sphingomonas sp. HITSZ_GF TaxID=3037247 RepID=UPI00240D61D2|nr:FAD-dependent oxidoreductase [Sphingomonas sp. HITSZ_GF]MDG2534173.1 FAD-dependent oxidoreductase [Sphingomonas sp. HITSZ_GF]
MTLSRRNLLGGAAAAGALAGIGPASARGGKPGGWGVIVVGAGVFGAWTAWTLQRRGEKVLLVDAFGAAHARSSSGGETRLIRTEYAGNELYTRWAWESLAEWQALSQRHESPIFQPVGALYIYGQDSAKIDHSIALQRSLGIPIEKLAAADLARRWPQMSFDGIAVGILQPTMGALMARRSIQTLVAEFVKAGGSFRQFAVDPPRSEGGALKAITGTGGETLTADRFVFACGPWLPKLFPEVVGNRIVPTRQDVFFFAPAPGDDRFEGRKQPAWVDASDIDLHYGFPNIEYRGFKIALDRHGPSFDPDASDRVVTQEALARVRGYLARRFPDLAHRPLAESRVCQYENSDNGHLLIDRHPGWANSWIVGGGSGHGFKHGPAVGRHVADLVLGAGKVEPALTLAQHQPHGGGE